MQSSVLSTKVHAMRDHPAHNVPLLGASWGARLSQVMFFSLACRGRLYPLPPRQVLVIIASRSSSAEHPREMATKLAQDVGGPFVLGGSQLQRARPGMEDCCQHINHSTIMCFPQELLTKYIWSWARHMAVIFYYRHNQLKCSDRKL